MHLVAKKLIVLPMRILALCRQRTDLEITALYWSWLSIGIT